MLKPVLTNPWVRAIGVLAALILVALTAYILGPVLIPLFLAFMVAYVLDPVVDFFERRRVPRIATIAALGLVAVLVLLAIPFVVVPSVYSQAQQLVRAAAQDTDHDLLDRILDRLPVETIVHILGIDQSGQLPSGTGSQTPAAGTSAPPEVSPRALLAEYIGNVVSQYAVQFLKNNVAGIAQFGQEAGRSLVGIVSSIGNAAVNFVLFVANLALFAVVAAYLLKDFDPLLASARSLIPPRYAPKAIAIIRKIDEQLRSFLRGQFTVACCLGVLYTIGFLISGTPFALVIGAFAILASFVPFVGVASVALISLSLTAIQHGLDWHVLGVLVTVAVVQALEGNVLTPKIVGDRVGLNPVWVILAIMVFGNLMGFLGLLVAVPTAAVLKVLVVEGVTLYKTSPIFEGGDPEGGAASG